MNYSFKKYIKENVDTIHLPTGEDLSFMQDKQAVMFIANNGYFLFAQKQGNRAKVVILKNVQKILEFEHNCLKTLIHAGMIEVLEDFKTFYATDKSLYEIAISFDEMDNVIKMSDSIVHCDFNESTGRVFPKGRAVQVDSKTGEEVTNNEENK